MATVKVKIAVAVDPTGLWCAHGATEISDDDAFDTPVECVGFGEARYWVTAELAIPEPTTVEGVVAEADEVKL